MSRLQDLVHSLITVITGYNRIILGNVYPLETLLAQPHFELEQTLLAITNEATTSRSYDKRRPLFDYFLYEIKALKPLVDKKEPLTQEEYEKIQNDLTSIINNVKLLLTKYQNEIVIVSYDGKNVEIVGALYGWSSFSKSGQVLNAWLKDPMYFPLAEFDTAAFVATNLEKHQAIVSFPLLQSQKMQLEDEFNSTKKASSALQEELNSAKKALSGLQEELNSVKNCASALQEELVFTQQSVTTYQLELEQLKKLYNSLQEENESLKLQQEKEKPDNPQIALANKIIAPLLYGNFLYRRQQYPGLFFNPQITARLPINPTQSPREEEKSTFDLTHS